MIFVSMVKSNVQFRLTLLILMISQDITPRDNEKLALD